RPSDEPFVLRDGARVAVVRGLDAAFAEDVARTLLQLPGDAPAPAPLAIGIQLLPEHAQPDRLPSRILGSEWLSPWLGIRAGLPPGMRFQLDSEGVDLQIDRPGTPIGMF